MTAAAESRLERLLTEADFSGVVLVSRGGDTLYERARGLAHRAFGVPNEIGTQFALASGTKGFTACAVLALVGEGRLTLETPVDAVLADPRFAVGPAVTVGHLLTHRSGIGDYLDESVIEDIEDYLMPVPVHQLAEPAAYLPIVCGLPPKFVPGSAFSYCNGAYVLLARIVELVSGESYYDVVDRTVFRPARMTSSAFLRSDDLPASAALGYLPTRGFRTNTLHVPVRGAGDGGAYATAHDVVRFWSALCGGALLEPKVVAQMFRPTTEGAAAHEPKRYGIGCWLLSDRDTPVLVGCDAGISFYSAHDPASGVTTVAISNRASGVSPVEPALEAWLRELADAG